MARLGRPYDPEPIRKQYSPDQVLGRIKRKITPHMDCYYVFGISDEGKRVTLGPFLDEHKADVVLNDLDNGEIFKLPTRDLSKATRIIKATIASRGHDMDDALSRHRHQLRRR